MWQPPPGVAFIERSKALLADWDQAEDELVAAWRAVSGHLIVSAPAAFGRKPVAPRTPALLAGKPGLQMSFTLTDRVVDLVREGYDLSIRTGGAVDPNFVAVKLATNRRVVCGTPANFARHGRPRSLEDLLGHNCLAFDLQRGQNRGWYFQRGGKRLTRSRRLIGSPVRRGCSKSSPIMRNRRYFGSAFAGSQAVCLSVAG